MSNDELAIRERLAGELVQLGVSYREIAKIIGISHAQVANYFAWKETPTRPTLLKMHRAGIDILYILTGHRLLVDIHHDCTTCGHYCDGDSPVCEKYDYDCQRCPKSKVCRECRNNSNWRWRGFNYPQEATTDAEK